MESLLLHSFLTEAPVLAAAAVASAYGAVVLTKSIVEKTQESEEEVAEQE